MSGIYGIFGSGDETAASSMKYVAGWNLAYGDGNYYEKTFTNAGLGVCPDHITNAPVNRTPVICEDKYAAVIDAVIYNRSDLIEEYKLPSDFADEQLLLRCVLDYGYDVLSEINGDFSGAVLNNETGELVLFRDHIGVRPLFYYKNRDFIAFSTDIRGLIALPEVSGAINPDWLYKEICGFDPVDRVVTEVSDVFEVCPATYMVIKQGAQGLFCTEKEYWTIGTRRIRLRSEKAYCDRLRELITDSVRRRLDVFPDKIGAELSGGLDSGVIDILINRLGREGIYYSWSFSPDDLPLVPDDERQVIADICNQEGMYCYYGNTTMDVGPESNIGRSHSRIGLEVDPRKDSKFNYAFPLYINTEIIAETAQLIKSKGGKVVFSGHGGDEGVSHRMDPYEMYYHHEYLRYFRFLWDNNGNVRNAGHRLITTLKQFRYRPKVAAKYARRPFNAGDGAPEILKQSFTDMYDDRLMPVLTFAFDSVRYVNSGNTHIRLLVAALLGAYSGARYVFPYLDYRVIDYAVSIPRYLYLKGEQNRYIFRQTFRDIMPESLYTCTAKDNPSTANMETDTSDWFEKMKPFKKWISESLDREFWKDYLDFDEIDKWVNSPRPADDEYGHHRNIAKRLRECYQYQNMISVIKDLNRKNSI